jgi:hypothetical protein
VHYEGLAGRSLWVVGKSSSICRFLSNAGECAA